MDSIDTCICQHVDKDLLTHSFTLVDHKACWSIKPIVIVAYWLYFNILINLSDKLIVISYL